MTQAHEDTTLARLEKEKKFQNIAIEFDPRPDAKITIPNSMTKEQVILVLYEQIEQDRMVTSFLEEIPCFPLDGAYGLMVVLKSIFGWVSSVPTPGFFGPVPPKMLELPISRTEKVPVLWGGFKIPGLESQINCGGRINNKGQATFYIQGECKQSELSTVRGIAQKVREWLRSNSVYRGKAIRLSVDADGQLILTTPPEFMDIMNLGGARLILDEEVERQLEAHLFTPIRDTDVVRKAGVPLKRGVLFEGPYGTGKTLAANVVANEAETNGWTFIYVKSVDAIEAAISFAEQYLPAVIFAEDVDQILGTDARNEKVNRVLNIVDGVDSKSSELMLIFTTNHIEKLNKALMRPGRLDTVVSFSYPKLSTVTRLIEFYGKNLLEYDCDCSKAAQALVDVQAIPAVVREVVENAKLYAIARMGPDEREEFKNGKRSFEVNSSDLYVSAVSIIRQRDIIAGKKDTTPLPLVQQLENEREARFEELQKKTSKIEELVSQMAG